MTNFEIRQIKNLKFIYFYTRESDNYLGLDIVYDGNKRLSFEYTDECFNEYVGIVVNTYKKEKDKHKIDFLNEESKEILSSFLNKDFSIKKIDENLTDIRDSKFNRRDIDVSFIKDYIKRAIFLFLKTTSDNIKIESFLGHKDKYLITYLNNEKENYIPLYIIKQDDKHYLFKFRYVNSDSISFDGNVNVYDEFISLLFKSKDEKLISENVYHINEDNSFETIKYYGVLKSYEKPEEITKEDNNVIDYYLNLLNLPLLKTRVKTAGNNYLLTEDIDENTKYSMHLSISKDFINIIFNKSYVIKQDDNFVPLEKEKISINIINNYPEILIEKRYMPVLPSTGEYKKYENKFSYESINANISDLINPPLINRVKSLKKEGENNE